NVVPEYAKVWIWLRDLEMSSVEEMLGRIRKMAEGSAMAADVTSTVTIQTGDWNMNVNMAGQQLMYSNLAWLGPLQFTEAEQEFAKSIQHATNVPEKGLI